MLYISLKTLHLLAVIVWIGGMVFAQFFLRPAVAILAIPDRVRLMHDVVGRFFDAVLFLALLVLVTGGWMIARPARQMALSGVKFNMPLEWTVMAALGLVMLVIFGYLRWVLYQRLTRAVAALDWAAGAAALAGIRTWVMVNLVIGVVIVLVTLSGAAS